MFYQLQKLVSLIIRCHKSWAVAAPAVFGVTQLGAPAVCNVRPVKYGAFDKRFWHVTLTYRTINFKQHLLYTNISLIHLIIQTLWSFVDLKYCVCTYKYIHKYDSWILCELQRIDIWENRKKKFCIEDFSLNNRNFTIKWKKSINNMAF